MEEDIRMMLHNLSYHFDFYDRAGTMVGIDMALQNLIDECPIRLRSDSLELEGKLYRKGV